MRSALSIPTGFTHDSFSFPANFYVLSRAIVYGANKQVIANCESGYTHTQREYTPNRHHKYRVWPIQFSGFV